MGDLNGKYGEPIAILGHIIIVFNAKRVAVRQNPSEKRFCVNGGGVEKHLV